MIESLLNVIKSNGFKQRLRAAAENHFHLKQEVVIKNAIVEVFNKIVSKKRAFAEIKQGQNRVDIVISNNKLKTYVEIKYQFNRDFNNNSNRGKITDNINRSDLFILIIPVWNNDSSKKARKENGITQGLEQFNTHGDLTFIKHLIEIFKNKEVNTYKIEAKKPYPVTYNFFIVKGNRETKK